LENFEYGINHRFDYQILNQPVGKEEQKPTISFTIKFTSSIAFAIGISFTIGISFAIAISFEFCFMKALARFFITQLICAHARICSNL
ncbi:hypothetical protein T12_1494, partial [Trichinella patagoniensis]